MRYAILFIAYLTTQQWELLLTNGQHISPNTLSTILSSLTTSITSPSNHGLSDNHNISTLSSKPQQLQPLPPISTLNIYLFISHFPSPKPDIPNSDLHSLNIIFHPSFLPSSFLRGPLNLPFIKVIFSTRRPNPPSKVPTWQHNRRRRYSQTNGKIRLSSFQVQSQRNKWIHETGSSHRTSKGISRWRYPSTKDECKWSEGGSWGIPMTTMIASTSLVPFTTMILLLFNYTSFKHWILRWFQPCYNTTTMTSTCCEWRTSRSKGFQCNETRRGDK